MPLSAHTAFLSHSRILRKYLDGYWPDEDPDLSELSLALFTALRENNPGQPDYIHSTRIRAARRNVAQSFTTYLDQEEFDEGIPENFSLRARLTHAIRRLAKEFFFEQSGMLYVHASAFESWQECLTMLSPLPLLAAASLRQHPEDLVSAQKLVLRMLRHSSLPGCYETELDDMIRGGESLSKGRFAAGLDDLHIHLDGTTEASQTWLHCLRQPLATLRNLRAQWRKSTVRQFYTERGITSSLTLYHIFCLADWLRCWMLEVLFPSLTLSEQESSAPAREESSQRLLMREELCSLPLSLQDLRCGLSLEAVGRHPHFTWRGLRFSHPLGTRRLRNPLSDKATPLQMEGVFLLYALDELFNGSDSRFPIMLHCYLLLQNSFIQLVVQQKQQVGFDQFQHITDNALREAAEKEYQERFNQLHGMYGPDLSYVEGRFAPPDDPHKCIELVERIVQGYWRQFPWLREGDGFRYDNDKTGAETGFDQAKAQADGQNKQCLDGTSAPFTLRLVAHFIKKPDNAAEEHFCRHYSLRRDLEKRCAALLQAQRFSPLVRKYLVGVDAAANEMHAPPEVFAPIFRRCRGAIRNFTYHVGEDFLHLVSGLRAIAEAIRYLDMKSGDRLGHCTALGINPDIWLRAMGEKCYCPRGEWLDNLVWMAHVLEGKPKFSSELAAFKEEINLRFSEIYPSDVVDKNAQDRRVLLAAWKLRDIDPVKALWMDEGWENWRAAPLSCDAETAYAWNKITKEQKVYEQFKLYHDPKFRKKYAEVIAINTKQTPPELLCFLQDDLVGHLNQKQLVVEVMPTSNLFISFYTRYKEHHLFRWMEKNPDRPAPRFCLGSDDPGIFSTNMRNEMTHILHVARDLYPGPSAPLGAIRSLVRRGRAARFGQSKECEESEGNI